MYRAIGANSGGMLWLTTNLLSPFKSTSQKTILPTGPAVHARKQHMQLGQTFTTCSCWLPPCNVIYHMAGAKPVPPTPTADIDRALQDLESNKGRWVAQSCAARAKLLRASIEATVEVDFATLQL